VLRRRNAEEALAPARKHEGAMPRKGEARNVSSQVLWAVGDSQTDTGDSGHITEEPCAAKVARTVLKQRWRERSLHRL
jgi:hypothetical protein